MKNKNTKPKSKDIKQPKGTPIEMYQEFKRELGEDPADMFEPKIRRIKWLGEDLILVGGTHGAISTEGRYIRGELSLAHLYPDGNILMRGRHVGTKDDIIFGEFIELEPDPDAMANFLENIRMFL